MRSRRKHREVPLPRSFRPEQREHWLDRYEREIDEPEETRKRMAEACEEDGQPNLTNSSRAPN
jgi:hypothetical protein